MSIRTTNWQHRDACWLHRRNKIFKIKYITLNLKITGTLTINYINYLIQRIELEKKVNCLKYDSFFPSLCNGCALVYFSMLPVYCQAMKINLEGMPLLGSNRHSHGKFELADSVACAIKEGRAWELQVSLCLRQAT